MLGLIYLKELRQRVEDLPSADSFLKWPHWLALGQAESKNVELISGFQGGCQGCQGQFQLFLHGY